MHAQWVGFLGIEAVAAVVLKEEWRQAKTVADFTDYLKANAPDIQIIATVNEDGSAKSETDAAATLLQAHPDVNLIYNTDGAGSAFIAQVVKDQNLQGKVQIVDGLGAQDQIVVKGAFMVKSEMLKGTMGEG